MTALSVANRVYLVDQRHRIVLLETLLHLNMRQEGRMSQLSCSPQQQEAPAKRGRMRAQNENRIQHTPRLTLKTSDAGNRNRSYHG